MSAFAKYNLILWLILFVNQSESFGQQYEGYTYAPEFYVCQKLKSNDKIVIDGDILDRAWISATWIRQLVDIEGDIKPKPLYDTKIAMLWDGDFLYLAAELKEPHLWATMDKQDMYLFHENDFEVFLDPDGDTHHYGEIEINALATIWDLLLTKPYRDKGRAIDTWNITDIKKAVKLYGTLNNPSDKDDKWTVEMAIPWSVLEELNSHDGPPKHGESWKVNFSRVQWQLDVDQNKYTKRIDPKINKPYPEYNWVWSPQGAIAMHQPETWGLVIFDDQKSDMNNPIKEAKANEKVKWQLRQLYYQQKAFYQKHGIYTTTLKSDLSRSKMDIKVIGHTYIIQYCEGRKCFYINEDGRVWNTNK
jgi:Carbohydrate family 9 binding domain-like